MSKSLTWVHLNHRRWRNLKKTWFSLQIIALVQFLLLLAVKVYTLFRQSTGTTYVGFDILSNRAAILVNPATDLACQVSAALVLIAIPFASLAILGFLIQYLRQFYGGERVDFREELPTVVVYGCAYAFVIFDNFQAFTTCFGTKMSRYAIVFGYSVQASRINLLTATIVIAAAAFIISVGSILLLLHWYRHDRREWRFFIANYTNFNESPLTFREFCAINGPY